MKRRGSTEARVAIFKNVIMHNPVREKSIGARGGTKPRQKPRAKPEPPRRAT